MVMKALRRATKPVVWIVAFAFIGTIFLAWGMDFTRRPGEKGIIGEISGVDIKDEQYRQVLNYMHYQRNNEKSGQELTEAEARQMRDDAFNTIINEMMFAHERERLGLELSDNELVDHLRRFPPDFLRSNPSFANEEGGAFSYEKYQQAMNDPQLGQFWAQVEGIIRPQMLQMKLQEFVVSLTHITDPEVKMFFDAGQTKRKLRYVAVPFSEFANKIAAVDSSAVEAYYQTHREDYFQNEMAELFYAGFNKLPSREDTAVVLNELTDFRRRIDDGEDFNELSRTFSDEPSAAQTGGDLGWFGHGRMVAPFEEVAFVLDSGQISEPVLTRFGYHLLKSHGKRVVNDSDEVHISHILLKLEASGRTLSDLRLKAQQFAEDAEVGELSWDSLCTSYGINGRFTGKFERNSNILGFGQDKNVEEFAFRGKVGAISNVIDKDRFFAVCQIKGRYPAGIQPLDDVWTKVEQAAKTKMGADSSLAAIRAVEAEMSAGKTLAEAAEATGRSADETDFFGRFETIRNFGSEPAFRGVAFSLTPEEPISPVFKTTGKYCILELLEETTPDPELYTAQRDSLFQVVLGGKQNQMYQLWYDDLYEKSEVKDFRYQIPGGY